LAVQNPLLLQQAAGWQAQAAAPVQLQGTPAGLLAPAHWLLVCYCAVSCIQQQQKADLMEYLNADVAPDLLLRSSSAPYPCLQPEENALR
jgi:hypothetical protein